MWCVAIYFNRLQCLRPALIEQAKSYLAKWTASDTATLSGMNSGSGGSGGGSGGGSSAAAAAASAAHAKPVLCEKTLDLSRGTPSIIIGTLYKEMKYKPCILDEYAKERGVEAAVSTGPTLVAADDTLVLEDEFGRVGLTSTAGSNDLPVSLLVTGMVVAVVGAESDHGLFHVAKVIVPELPEQLPLPIGVSCYLLGRLFAIRF